VADMARAAKWIRVSSGGQDEANQEPDVDKHCANLGYNVVKTFTLHDKSASKGQQEKYLAEVLADIRNHEYQVLVCWHSDRLERRGVLETLMFIAQVKEAGGRVESTQEGILDEDNLNTIINAHMNKQKTDHLTEQVRLAHDRIRQNGALHGRAPWGMAITGPKYGKQLTGTDEGRTWVPRIFGKVIDGWSLARISRWLEAEGVGGPDYTWHKEAGDYSRTIAKADGQLPWHESTIGAMVRNPAYMGFRCHQDPKTKKYGKILHKCEALVDPGTWRQANEALDKRPKRGYTNPDTRAMLAGVLKCGNPQCNATGAPDSPMNRSRSSTKVYYRCTGTGAVRRSCGTMVPLELADAAVDRIVSETFNVPRLVRKVIPGTDHTAELASLDFELQQLPALKLPWGEEDAERARLRAEYTRIADLPVVPDEEVMVNTGETYADLWNATRPADRGEWLAANGFTVRASRTHVTVSQGGVSATVTLSG
jgi:DNA invertase Pin-like site-specific DNA recombinase